MRCRLFPAVVVLVHLAPLAILAQQVRTIRVCVVGRDISNTSPRVVNSTAEACTQRDLLVNTLNHHKPTANSQVKLEAVALTSQDLTANANEATKIGCTYYVTLSVGSSPHDKQASSVSRSGLAEAAIPAQPSTIGVSILRVEAQHEWVPLPNGSFIPRGQAAMSVAGDVYDAIVKNATR